MTPMNRILPLACAVWMLALYMAAPHAAQTAETAEGGVKVSEKDIQKNLSLFTPSENCVACHNNLITPTGEDVSIGASWRSTMMANSGRDPYWQAGVRRETIDHPTHSAAIQEGQRHRAPEVCRRQHFVHGLPSDRERQAGDPRALQR